MLVKFSLENFRTFRNRAVLSMIATNYDKTRDDENIYTCEAFNLRLLRSALIYGANASGKSKIMEALQFMRLFILSSSLDSRKGDVIPVTPFMLNETTQTLPSEFEIIFIHNNEMFRYGFEVTRSEVVAEWLFHRPKTKEVEIFYRENQVFNLHRDFLVGKKLVDDKMVRNNALLLSVAAQFNDNLSGKVFDWMYGLKVIPALETSGYKGFSTESIGKPETKKKILDMLHKADISITDLELREQETDGSRLTNTEEPSLQKFLTSQRNRMKGTNKVFALHDVYDEQNQVVDQVAFDFESEESSGTNQFFALSGPIIEVLEKGWVLAVDELDSKLHPLLVQKIVELFNSKEVNRNNAQLIFNTHDTNLLNTLLYRRDQIWFVKKDRFGAAQLYSLADFKSAVRNSEQYEKNYMQGKYGAIPVVNDLIPDYGSKTPDE